MEESMGNCCGGHKHGHKNELGMKEKDPVCGMAVDPSGPHKLSHGGKPYHFCSAHCLAKFRATPEKFLKPAPPPEPTREGSKTTYTCPMHPEIQQNGPGNCPLCGMALEPIEPSL